MNEILVGIDEAGRGTWAGPLVAAAVAIDEKFDLPKLTDSKLLSAKIRRELLLQIRQQAVSIGIGWVSPQFIDEFGLTLATTKAMQAAVDQLNCDFNLAIIDGNLQYLPEGRFRCVIGADKLHPEVSAASVVAKVARDAYMEGMDLVHPGYSFSKHAGYGTKAHVEALMELGVSPIHRLSYKPVQKIHVNQSRQTG